MAIYELEKSELQLKDEFKHFAFVRIYAGKEEGKEIFTISAFDTDEDEYQYYVWRKQHIKKFKTMNYVWEEIKEVFPNVTKVLIQKR